MKKYLILALLFVNLNAYSQKADKVYLFSYFVDNGQDGLHLLYSEDGLKWEKLNEGKSFLKPEVGRDKLMRDPCIITGPDGKFHMVWTVSWNEKGIGYASSSNLKDWSKQKYLPVMEGEPGARNCWAPELFFDQDQDLYLIYWATTIPGKFPETDSTGDDSYNHRMYYTTTRDFVNFSETKLLYDQGFNVIDAVIVKTGAKYTMFLKDETRHPAEKNIRIATSSDLTEGYSTPGPKISPDWVEGPTVIKKGDEWIVYFDMYTKHKMGAVKSKDLVHWVDITDQLEFPEGTRHGTIFQVDKKVLKRLLKE